MPLVRFKDPRLLVEIPAAWAIELYRIILVTVGAPDDLANIRPGRGHGPDAPSPGLTRKENDGLAVARPVRKLQYVLTAEVNSRKPRAVRVHYIDAGSPDIVALVILIFETNLLAARRPAWIVADRLPAVVHLTSGQPGHARSVGAHGIDVVPQERPWRVSTRRPRGWAMLPAIPSDRGAASSQALSVGPEVPHSSVAAYASCRTRFVPNPAPFRAGFRPRRHRASGCRD
jgi:hypothetical protein